MTSHNARILVVEDQKNTRQIIGTLYLVDNGFNEVDMAEDGLAAWEMLETASQMKRPHDLVICDWTMPRLDGLGLLKKMRADARFAKTPFILLTAHAEKNDVVEAASAGVRYYVTKPFAPETLLAKIEEALAGA